MQWHTVYVSSQEESLLVDHSQPKFIVLDVPSSAAHDLYFCLTEKTYAHGSLINCLNQA